MRNIFLTLILGVCLGCVNRENQNEIAVNQENDIDTILSDSANLKTATTIKKQELSFLYENDTVLQKLSIKSLTSKALIFSLTSTNKAKNKISSIEGTAKAKSSSDPEIDEDEEGNAYPAQVYLFEKDCWLSFRIDMELKDKIRIVEADCEKLHDESCPFSSVGTLRLIK